MRIYSKKSDNRKINKKYQFTDDLLVLQLCVGILIHMARDILMYLLTFLHTWLGMFKLTQRTNDLQANMFFYKTGLFE